MVLKFYLYTYTHTDDASSLRNSMTLPTSSNSQQGVAFTERFKPVENGRTSDDLYSLAAAAEYDVHRQLSKEQEVPPGTPLSEALASKKIGNKRRSGSLSSHTSNSSTSGSDATSTRLSGISETSYFTPRPIDSPGFLGSIDPHSLYASPPNNASLLPGGPKPRSATLMPTLPTGGYNHLTPNDSPPQQGQRSSTNADGIDGMFSTSSSYSEGGAETLENGYMRPRPTVGRVPDYDYPPLGPPRPANTNQGNTSPRQHRSALLKNDRDRVVPPTPPNSLVDSGSTPFDHNPHMYINMQELLEGLPPPPVDRSKKPTPLLAPRVDRSLKPSHKGENSSSEAAGSMGELPPDFPTRTDFVSGNASGDDSDVPKVTKRSTCYTQVQFDPATRRPIPLPRTGQPKPGAGVRRVNYSDVDLEATKILAEKKSSLGQAEMEALAEKYYINVNHTGSIDDDTNPDYYTHMRVSCDCSDVGGHTGLCEEEIILY